MNKISQTVPYQFDTVFSPFKAEEFESALAFLAGAGFTGVEVAVARPQDVDPEKLLSSVEKHTLAITSISTGQAYGLYGLFLASGDKDVQNGAIDFVKGHIDLSAAVGKPVVTIGLLRCKMEQDAPATLMQRFKEAMDPCVDYAVKRGVNLQVEPINKAETVLINSTYDCLDFLQSIGNPKNVGILYDAYHSNLEDGDMLAAVQAAAGRIMNVHLADSHRGLPGYGDIDFKALYKAIQATGYTGPYALETLAIPSAEFVNEHCFASVQAIME